MKNHQKPRPIEVFFTTVALVVALCVYVPTDYQKKFGNSVREKPVTELTQSTSAPLTPTIN